MILYHIEEADFKFPYGFKKKCSLWIKNAILSEQKKIGTINIIITTDDILLSKNIQFLSHNYYTDILTFDFSHKNKINGDLYISIDRIAENSKTFKETPIIELKRVIIHGILHLAGFNDHTPEEKMIMTQKENFYLNLF